MTEEKTLERKRLEEKRQRLRRRSYICKDIRRISWDKGLPASWYWWTGRGPPYPTGSVSGGSPGGPAGSHYYKLYYVTKTYSKNHVFSMMILGQSNQDLFIFLFFKAYRGLWFLLLYCTVLTVRSAAPQTTLWGGNGPRLENGQGGQAGALTTRPPHLLAIF